MNVDRAKEMLTGMHQGVSIVTKYMKHCDDNLLETLLKPSRREAYMRGQFLRALFWMLTLEKLSNPRDIQAVQCCMRSLIEITIDMVILHHDKTSSTVRMMLHWDRSQKLHMAQPMLEYYKKYNRPVADENKDVEEFVKTKRSRIEKKRLSFWPNKKNKPKHPSRWSGDRSLLADAIDADRYYGAVIKDNLGVTLEELYETEYRLLNWYVHGSGLAGVMNLEPVVFYWLCGLAYKWCYDLAMLCTKIILTDYEFSEYLPGLSSKWDELKLATGLAYLNQVKTPLSQDPL